MFVRTRELALTLGCLMLSWTVVPLVSAQTVRGSIFGTVTDATGARLPGVAVAASSPQLITGQEVGTTGAEGTYRLSQLAPGTYTVTFELQGFQTVKREGIRLLAGQSLAVDGQLQLAQVAESVTVTGEAPLIDTRTSALVNIADAATLENIPLARNYTELLNIMPGVIDAKYVFSPMNVVHGGNVRQNAYSLDGIYTNDSLTGASSTQFPVDSIQEVQLTTAGITAEYGDASGAVFNYVTKSGGDQFAGGGSFYFQNRSTESDNVSDDLREQGITVASGFEHIYDASGFLGGPIKKEKAWFFGNYRYLDLAEARSDFPRSLSNTDKQSFIKGTVQLGASNRVEGSFHTRNHLNFPFTPTANFANAGDPRTWMGLRRKNTVGLLRWTSVINDNTLFELRGSFGFYDLQAENPNNDGSTSYIDVATGIISGGDFHTVGGNERDRHQARGDLTYFKPDWGGSHEFKMGLNYQKTPNFIEQFLQGARGPNELTGCNDGCISSTPDVQHFLFNGAPFRVQLHNFPSLKSNEFSIVSAYLQDQWVVAERVTLNLGIRLDHSRGSTKESSIGGGAFDELQTFAEQSGIVSFDNVAPRFGLVWDVRGDHETTLKASAGRFYSQPLNVWLNTINPAVSGFREFDWVDANGDRVYQAGEETLLRVDSRPDPETGPGVDPDLQNQFTDVYTIGVEHQLSESWALQVTGIFKRDGNLIGIVNDAVPVTAYQRITVTNPLNGQPLEVFTLPAEFLGVRPQIVATNPGERPGDPQPLERSYNGVEIVLDKRFVDKWSLQASYVYGRAEGNVSNSFAGSEWADYTNPNFFINRLGALAMNRDHQFKVFGAYQAPYGFLLSGFLEVLSGFPFTDNYQRFAQESPRGATEVRIFAADNPQILSETFIDVAGEPAGSRTFDTQTTLQVRVEKRFDLGFGGFTLAADIFNIFNSNTVVRVRNLRLDNPNYLVPAELLAPRVLRVGLKFDF